MRDARGFYQRRFTGANPLFVALLLTACKPDRVEKKIEAPPRALEVRTVTGRIVFSTPPSRTTTPLPENVHRVCGETLDEPPLNEVVVWWDEAPSEETTPGEVQIDQKRCAYTPRVVATTAKSTVAITNSDPLLHNVRADPLRRSGATPAFAFNVAMPIEKQTLKRTLSAKHEITVLRCDVHPWMRAWILTFPHRYWAIAKPDGSFSLPMGEGTLKVFSPVWAQPKTLKVETSDLGDVTL